MFGRYKKNKGKIGRNGVKNQILNIITGIIKSLESKSKRGYINQGSNYVALTHQPRTLPQNHLKWPMLPNKNSKQCI